ncbi:MAG TPA: SDR family oxidoreductase [Verrucomicrobiae bacterium]|nr:SDR family oxidoreductase [Verrucomicrobiae bacterium]
MIAFITGASAGFGAAIARRLAADGVRVVLAARRRERLEQLARELGGKAHVVELDVRDNAAVERVAASLPNDFNDVDVLVNNAGLALGLDPAHKASLDDWNEMVDTNIKGLMYVTRALLPGMVARGRGHVVNIGSVAGEWPYPGGNVYGASKAFVHQFSLNLRADLLGTKLRVTDLEPGLCGGTEFSQVRFHGDAARAASVYKDTQSLGAEDIADAVHWAVTRPAHVNVNTISLMPVTQAFGPLAVHRLG